MPVGTALEHLNTSEKGVSRVGYISDTDNFKDVVQKLFNSTERKVFELQNNKVVRIVTETDIFSYFTQNFSNSL